MTSRADIKSTAGAATVMRVSMRAAALSSSCCATSISDAENASLPLPCSMTWRTVDEQRSSSSSTAPRDANRQVWAICCACGIGAGCDDGAGDGRHGFTGEEQARHYAVGAGGLELTERRAQHRNVRTPLAVRHDRKPDELQLYFDQRCRERLPTATLQYDAKTSGFGALNTLAHGKDRGVEC